MLICRHAREAMHSGMSGLLGPSYDRLDLVAFAPALLNGS